MRPANPSRHPSSRVLVTDTARACGRLVVLVMATVLAACVRYDEARAQVVGAGLSLGWQDCRTAPGAGADNQNFGCTVTINDLPLIPALKLTTAIDSVIACELVIDVGLATSTLPPWWHMEPGGCARDAVGVERVPRDRRVVPGRVAGAGDRAGHSCAHELPRQHLRPRPPRRSRWRPCRASSARLERDIPSRSAASPFEVTTH
jgi:hypothetical protein